MVCFIFESFDQLKSLSVSGEALEFIFKEQTPVAGEILVTHFLQSPGSQDGVGRGHWDGIAELSHAGWPLDMGAAEKLKEKHVQSGPLEETNFIN